MIAIAILKMPRCMNDKMMRVQAILSLLQNNAYIISMWGTNAVSLTDFESHVQTFNDAQVNTKQRTVGLVALRNEALSVLMIDLMQICKMVEAIANITPQAAQTIIESAGSSLKGSGHRPKQINAAYNTQIEGIVKLTADGQRAHEWEMSKDQINITYLPSTTTAYTYVKNLTAGDIWYFRNKKVDTKKATYNWSPWITLGVGSGGKTVGAKSPSNSAGSIAA